jgi:hypothetical protein
MCDEHEGHMPYIGDLARTMCSGQTSKRKCVLLCVPALLGVLVLVVLMRTLVRQLEATSNQQFDPERAALQALTADQIAQVQIVDRCVVPAAQFDAFIQALHDVTHFRVTPDPASYFGRLRITLQSGSIQEYRLYRYAYGMVLELVADTDSAIRQPSNSTQSGEYVISRALPDVLRCEQAGVAVR